MVALPSLGTMQMTGRHLMDILEHGLRVVHILEAQVLRQGLAVEAPS